MVVDCLCTAVAIKVHKCESCVHVYIVYFPEFLLFPLSYILSFLFSSSLSISPPPPPPPLSLSLLQNANVDKLTRDMKRLKLIPNSWRSYDVATPKVAKTPPTYRSPGRSPVTPTEVASNGFGVEHGVGSSSGERRSADVMQTPVIDRMLSSERLIKLRESLSNITQTPVRTLLPGEL